MKKAGKTRFAEISMKASGVCAGVAFFGGLDSNFQLIIKCPIHIYSVIRKYLSGSNHDIESRFFSGSIEIADLALPQFRGDFKFVSANGKVKKYHAAFVYPLMADYMVLPDEFARLSSFCALMDLNKYEYYDKQNRSFRQILNVFSLPRQIGLEDIDESFCCVQAVESK